MHVLQQLKYLECKALYDFAVKNEKQIHSAKKQLKELNQDLFYVPEIISETKIKTFAKKDNSGQPVQECETGVIKIKIVGNAAWWFDCDGDVIADTAYTKTVKERGLNIPHIADHNHKSTAHVGDVTACYTEKVKLTDLGLKSTGNPRLVIY